MNISHWLLWQKVLFFSGITVAVILILLGFVLWVVFPIIFMKCLPVQRFFTFLNINQPKNPEFNKPENYGLSGVINFYILTTDADTLKPVRIGAWMILPEREQNESGFPILHNIDTAIQFLKATKKPIILYSHGAACNRILPIRVYRVASQFSLVIAVDHRGYGDSSKFVDLTEEGIVNDTVQIYRWIRSHTKNEIFLWGHTLGAALCTHTVRHLQENNIVPMGLILESPFSTMREELLHSKISKPFKWLLYFNKTFLEPLEKNGFYFVSTENIVYVDCPILIMNAENDSFIPCTLGKKLYEVARTKRNLKTQGSVTYHQFSATAHTRFSIVDGLVMNNKLPQYLEEFIEQCRAENKMRG